MKLVPKMLVVTVALSAYNAYAGCGEGTTVFSCLTAKSKKIEVCDLGKTIKYSYGKTGNPEIVLKLPRSHVSTSQWNGMGRYESYSVNIPNADVVYEVFDSRDRHTEKREAGVNVEQNGNLLTTVNCKRNIKSQIIGINLKSSK